MRVQRALICVSNVLREYTLGEELHAVTFLSCSHHTASHAHTLRHTPVSTAYSLTLEETEVRCTLRGVNPRKAAGPDGVAGQVLEECAGQLAEVFTKIFILSLSQSTVPPCLSVRHLPKRRVLNTLNDYCPVALTNYHEVL